jgi:hypothetical protein
MRLLSLFLMSALFVSCGTLFSSEPETGGDNLQTQDYGWCVLTCPKTCEPGQTFELKLDLRNLKEISRNWEADKLAVHLFWAGKGKGGYLCPFKSVGVSKDGVVVLKGKFNLNDKIRADAEYVSAKVVLTSDWGKQDENKAADFVGPKIGIIKGK